MSAPLPEPSDAAREALIDRAADAALFGDALSREERELAERLGIDLQLEIAELELAAAELAAATAAEHAPDHEPMPTDVRARLEAMATALHAPSVIPLPKPPARSQPTPVGRVALAAAAGLALGGVLAILVLRPGDRPTADSSVLEPASFVRLHPRAVHWAWTGTQDSHVVGPVKGEAFFDPETKEGVLEIEGLAANDPAREQYQLWIFDAERDERYPVDGGVFDMQPGGRALIPVTARLPVGKPVLFAVTVEKPGGVVVSDRRIALVAKP